MSLLNKGILAVRKSDLVVINVRGDASAFIADDDYLVVNSSDATVLADTSGVLQPADVPLAVDRKYWKLNGTSDGIEEMSAAEKTAVDDAASAAVTAAGDKAACEAAIRKHTRQAAADAALAADDITQAQRDAIFAE